MKKRALLTATVQSHIVQFHKPLIQLLKDNGYIVDIAARNNLAEKNGLQLDNVDTVFDIPFTRQPISYNNALCYYKLKKIIDKGNYQLISCNTPAAGVLTRIAAKKKKGRKIIYTAHGFHFYHGASMKNWLFYYPIEKVMAKRCDCLITINNEDYKLASKRFKTQVCRIHGVGADSSRFNISNTSVANSIKIKEGLEKKIVILCVGELNENKNQKLIINSLSTLKEQFPNILLLLAGNGPLDNELHQLVQEKKLNQYVKFLGYVTNLQDYMLASDMLVSCSFREGLPMNIVEAMLSHVPVVASKNRGNSELIRDGKTGFSFNPNNQAECIESVRKMLLDDNQKKNIIQNAYKFALKYTKESVYKELSDIYLGD